MTKKNQNMYLKKFKSGESKVYVGNYLHLITQHGNEIRVRRICGAGLDTFYLGAIELNRK